MYYLPVTLYLESQVKLHVWKCGCIAVISVAAMRGQTETLSDVFHRIFRDRESQTASPAQDAAPAASNGWAATGTGKTK
jgi:hypothetical protein